jgi:ribosomal protein S18 acetylase RimI-like enzyme
MTETTVRAYDPSSERDRQALWARKVDFETEIGETTGSAEKSSRYDSKLTDEYKRRWLAWVERCVDDDGRCLSLADAGAGVAGYVFVLPERLSFIWDAAVVNELYVVPEARGDGVADALFERAIAVAEEQALPIDRLLLDVDPENDRARRFYDRYGFEPWGGIIAREV